MDSQQKFKWPSQYKPINKRFSLWDTHKLHFQKAFKLIKEVEFMYIDSGQHIFLQRTGRQGTV